MRRNALIAIFFCLGLFAGCGQKAPLYLPGDPSKIQTDLPSQASGQEASSDDEEEEDDEQQ